MTLQRLIIIGSGGHAGVIASAAEYHNYSSHDSCDGTDTAPAGEPLGLHSDGFFRDLARRNR